MSLYFLWIVLKDVPAFRRTVNRQGTETEPVRIVAKTITGIERTGTNGSNVTIPAAGAVFTYTGAAASHLAVGDGAGALVAAIIFTGLVAASSILRPPSRCNLAPS